MCPGEVSLPHLVCLPRCPLLDVSSHPSMSVSPQASPKVSHQHCPVFICRALPWASFLEKLIGNVLQDLCSIELLRRKVPVVPSLSQHGKVWAPHYSKPCLPVCHGYYCSLVGASLFSLLAFSTQRHPLLKRTTIFPFTGVKITQRMR